MCNFSLKATEKFQEKYEGQWEIESTQIKKEKKRESMREKYVRYDSKKYPIGFNAKRRFQIKPI